jgi:hypothetical protein
MKHPLFPVLLCLLTVPSAFGLDFQSFPSAEELMPEETVQKLEVRQEEGLNRFFTDEEYLSYIPDCDLSDTVFEAVRESDYKIGVETLYLIPRARIAADLRESSRQEYLLALYNTLRSISTLQGIDYYSASRDRMRLLFDESWAISGPEERTRIEDPLVEEIPAEDTIYIHQRDLTFGTNRYRVEYLREEDAFSMNIVNITTMTYKIFPLVGKENMSMRLLVIPVREGLVFYGLNTVNMLDLAIFHKKMEASFTNRMIALFNWFSRKVDGWTSGRVDGFNELTG